MKFFIADAPNDILEFNTLEEFAMWTNEVVCPRFVLVPPHTKRHAWSGVENNTDMWMIWTYPDYDQENNK